MQTTSAPSPAAAFSPVLVGRLELDGEGDAVAPALAAKLLSAPDARSARVLVRLHGRPVGMLSVSADDGTDGADGAGHTDGTAGPLARPAVLAAVRAAAAGDQMPELLAHCAADGLSVEDVLTGRAAATGGHECRRALPAPSSTPPVSVIVPTAGRAEQLAVAISSLLTLDYPDLEVLIVDNQPENPSTRRTVESFDSPRLRYLAESGPGSSVARNRGIAEARGTILAFTDDDVIADPAWLQHTVAAFEHHPAATCVTGLVAPLELSTQAQLWFEEYGGFGKGYARRVFDLREHRPHEQPLYPFVGGVFGSGNSMAFRADALRAMGGFDPALGAGSRALAGADIEAFIHLLQRGDQLVYEPAALIWHQHRRDYQALRRQVYNYGVGFTAILTKWLLRDPRLIGRLLLTAPRIVTTLFASSSRHNAAKSSTFPAELAAVERQGFVRGPLYYARSKRWAARIGIDRRPWQDPQPAAQPVASSGPGGRP